MLDDLEEIRDIKASRSVSSKPKKLKASKMTMQNIKYYLPKSRKMVNLYESLPIHKKNIFYNIYQAGYLEPIESEDKKAWILFGVVWVGLSIACNIFVPAIYSEYSFLFVALEPSTRGFYLGLVSVMLAFALAVINKIYYHLNISKKQKEADSINYELASKAYGRAVDQPMNKGIGNKVSIEYVQKFNKDDLIKAQKSISTLKKKFANLQDSLGDLDGNILNLKSKK